MAEQCVFCAIVAGEAPATIVAHWPDAIALVPLGPVVDGHVLIIPRQHVDDFTADPAVTAATMRRASEYATRHQAANVITSMGRAATQSVFHLHVHIVPRTEDDGLMVPWGTVYGEDPQAPHWCRVAERLSGELAQLREPRDTREDLLRILSEHRACLSLNGRGSWTCTACPEWESQGRDWTDLDGRVLHYHDPDEIRSHQADVIAREFLVMPRALAQAPLPEGAAGE
ncbi:HIT domain-containing protein [Nocardia otitidiscaviarum]|uniref:HIT family protein n=1 Tax=Nocardia otitidiscaviarum TaxID=1823 RepID=UPI0018943AAA|nr:HIT domain-containing protein [Nocardia otitidiscaviarum]MBF6138093.1 HIT domain-containing protein [Nocardia otitidiscaviarum]